MSILVINAGSSSVKFALFDAANLDLIERGNQPTGPSGGVATSVAMLCDQISSENRRAPGAVCHRLIHGGADIDRPVRIDADMKNLIASRASLAPLHIPAGLEAIAATESAFPDVPQFGVFDTAFFAAILPEHYTLAVPQDWNVRRFGFHGISHQYCASRAVEMLQRDDPRVVICHLGQGSSASAVRGTTAVASTMGMTPLDGLPMGTRCGAVDPGVLLHLLRDRGMTVEQLDRALHHESGLLGVSGLSGDVRELQAAADAGNARAQLALDVFAERIIAVVGSLSAALGGLDALVFTGGIGENAIELRKQVCRRFAYLGVELDASMNQQCEPDADIAAPDSSARVLVIHTREDLTIARQCRNLIA